MKLITWNVNGLRAALKKGFLDWLKRERPDVLCVQEVKAQLEVLPPEVRRLDHYHGAWALAQKKGYSGVTTYSRREPRQSVIGLDVPEYDREGRLIVSYFDDFVLVNVYVPNGQPDLGRVPFKLAFCDTMLAALQKIRKKQPRLIICGDFNTAHQPIDLARPKQNEGNTGFLPIECAWLDKWIAHGYIDIFRAFESGAGHYSWWSYRADARSKNIGWRLDYFFVTSAVHADVKKVYYQPQVMGSDHCPMVLEM